MQKVRAPIYGRAFGKMGKGYIGKDATSDCPQIGFWQFGPNAPARPFSTLVTTGMSDRRMNLSPAAVQHGIRHRAEICMYVNEPRQEHFVCLNIAAKFPFDMKTFIAPGHTVECPSSLFPGSELSALMYLSLDWCPDGDVSKHLAIDGDAVELLWLVPITRAELTLKRAKGEGAILDLFQKNSHPLPLDEKRRSYV
jgi:hypothetical protein